MSYGDRLPTLWVGVMQIETHADGRDQVTVRSKYPVEVVVDDDTPRRSMAWLVRSADFRDPISTTSPRIGDRLLVLDSDAAPDETGRLRRWLAEVDEVFEGATGGTFDREWLLRPIRQMQPEDYLLT